MKKMLITGLFLILSGNVSAGVCGIGKIIEILEGHWDSNDFTIKVDYSVAGSDHPTTTFHNESGNVVYKRDSINSRKYEGIRELARLAFIHNINVSTYSHNDDCSNATFLSIYK